VTLSPIKNVIAAGLLVPFLSGCALLFPSGKGDEQTIDGAREITHLEKRRRKGTLQLKSGYTRTPLDINRDGKSDQWIYKNKSGTRVLVVRDIDFDRQKDVWQYYSENGQLVEIEHNLDEKAGIELIELRKQGVTRQKILSVDATGYFSIWKYYNDKGRLLRVERDRNQDGQIDTWEYFNKKGERTRVGWDEDLDGSADTFNRYQ
jgi:hypothetical protein